MQWLRERAHRNPWVAGFFDRARERRRSRHFGEHLQASIGMAVRWRRREAAVACLCTQVSELLAVRPPPPRKGSPSRITIREPDLSRIEAACRNPATIEIGADELQAAARVASLDPANVRAFQLYLAACWLHHEPLLASLRQVLSERIVIHMSCAPRLARANLSIASFASQRLPRVSHLKLIGNGDHSTFDAANGLLAVAAADSYESLPQKMFQGLALLVMACDPQCILKLDDDHRLRSAAALTPLFDFAAASREPMQMGQINRVLIPSAHHRAWHFGKCVDPDLNERILAAPTPLQWAAGSAGYLLNRPALWRILWASLYYDRWLNEILYEDLALAEVAAKTGIRIVNAPLARAIGAVSEY
ncbi:MAG TPA: hypothetical protein PKE27_14270 [Povalibacter sp.]|uniref:hypothetical protein n=1 Tax=Povalibacter sp. TaxID=1962978 RepID=UPI002C29797A|nr:hypothetical protein [Povalibacter sp.]HMN45739.1 hypothetical protein [Povalibacter sp.]